MDCNSGPLIMSNPMQDQSWQKYVPRKRELWSVEWFRLKPDSYIHRVIYNIECNLTDDAIRTGMDTGDWSDYEWYQDLYNRCKSALWMRGEEAC